MARTEAEKRAQERYMAKFAEMKIRMTPEEKAELQAAAKAQGVSMVQYVLDAVRYQMEEDQRKKAAGM